MAGHWIPWEVGLTKKREVLVVSRLLGVTPLEAAASCMMVWEWASDQSVDGYVLGITPVDVSIAVGIPGIGEAMADRLCGWIGISESWIFFPIWERFYGKSGKERWLNAARVRAHRQKTAVVRQSKRMGKNDEV